MELVMLGDPFSHLLQVHAKLVFLCQVKHPREMIATLVRLHFAEDLRVDGDIMPDNVAIYKLIEVGRKFKLILSNFINHWIVQMSLIKHKLIRLFSLRLLAYPSQSTL